MRWGADRGVWGKAVKQAGAHGVQVLPELWGVVAGFVKGVVEELCAGFVVGGEVASIVVEDPDPVGVEAEELRGRGWLHAGVLLGQSGGCFDHQCVNEGLGQVAAHLVLVGVVFLAEQLRGTAGGAGAFVPAAGLDRLVLLV